MAPADSSAQIGHDGADEALETPRFPIVGIGASAGGLEALTSLVDAFKLDTMALVVVQHMAPDHDSQLPAILSRSSTMVVQQIADGVRVEPNHLYVSPPNAGVALLHGVLHLMPRPAQQPIDAFFRSLAEDHGSRAVGVVLSGMGTDGTQGLKDILAHGGLTFCQEPSSARFDSMPRSALESGAAHRALTPESIAVELSTMGKHPFLARSATAHAPPLDRGEVAKLFILIRSAFGNDLTLYKPSSIGRRVERRMALLGIERLADYVRRAHDDRDELGALYRDILINVTSFFRDPEAFRVVREVVLPRILERKPRGATIRLWVPACSSGEEAYSLAIGLLEATEKAGVARRIQVFATDVDAQAIARARRAVYSARIEAEVSPERLERFFTRVGKDYQVSRSLRDLIIFSPHNITKDSPFSRIDLVSCRNLLIYMQPPLQKRVLRLLHYALEPDGFLVLGTSETVGDSADLFSLIDKKSKIYAKKNLPSPSVLSTHGRDGESAKDADGERRPGQSAQQVADRKLLERYVPASVLVDENLEVLQFRGDTGLYLAPPSGAATLNLMKLVRPELHMDVWRATRQALDGGTTVRVSAVRALDDAGSRPVSLEVVPILDAETKSRCLLVVFDRAPAPTVADPAPTGRVRGAIADSPDTDRVTPTTRVHDLEEDLASTRDYLQTTIEELETSNEELKSTNEELQSSNEELQSTNEELETSKEELQATNEELSTTNDELQHRVSDLWRSTTDLDNLLSHVEQPILFVDGALRIRSATDAAQKLLRLDERTPGCPLSEVAARFEEADVVGLVRRAIDRLVATSDQVRIAGRWFDARAVPYRSPGGVVDGATVILRDSAERGHELLLDIRAYADRLLAALPQPLAILDEGLHVLWVNTPFVEATTLGAREETGEPKVPGAALWAHAKLREAMVEALATGEAFRDLRVEHEIAPEERLVMQVSGSVLTGVGGTHRVLLLAIVRLDGQGAPRSKGG